MMITICKKLIILLILPVLFFSCNKFVNDITPDIQPEAAEVFRQDETATLALTTVYAKLFAEEASPYLTSLLTGLQADELKNPTVASSIEYYMNAIDPVSNLYCKNYWNKVYSYVYLLNAVIEGCTQSETLSPEIKKQLIAEARFTRAYLYFYLVNLYGDVPLSLTTDYAVNKSLNRAPAIQVYEQIVKDLKFAQLDLNTEYVGKNSLPGTEERVRPNKATATALLARVYLYTGHWTEAEQQASTLINNTSVYRLSPIEQVYFNNSSETIWALRPTFPNLTNVNTIDGSEYILSSSPITVGKVYLSPHFTQAFEDGDLRKEKWIGTYSDTSDNHSPDYQFPYKYKVKYGSDIKEYTILFRLAEQYLIRAEARAHQDRFNEALSDVNVIRRRAGLKSINMNNREMNWANISHIIMKERQTELFTEQGHRWLDLKRNTEFDTIMNGILTSKGGAWQREMKFWPIPASEILLNPNLQESAGYNY